MLEPYIYKSKIMIYLTIILKIFEELALFSCVSYIYSFIYRYPYAHIRGGGRKLNIFSSGLTLKKNNPFGYLSTKKVKVFYFNT